MPIGSLSPLLTGGRYYAQAAQQNMFTVYVSNSTVNPSSVGCSGLQVWNPPTSGRNLVLVDIGGLIATTSASLTSLALAYGVGQTSAPTGQSAAAAITSTMLGPATLGSGGVHATQVQAQPIALAVAAGTFVNAPTAFYNLLHNTAAIATTGEDPGFRINLEGKFIVPPASYVAIIAVPVGGGGLYADLTWIEAPL